MASPTPSSTPTPSKSTSEPNEQANESLGLTAADHIRALNRHAHAQLFDYALINRKPVSAEMKAKYAGRRLPNRNRLEAIEAIGICPVLGDYLDEDKVARHATNQVATDLMSLMSQVPDHHTTHR